uniref:Cytochrome b n=1 Tax=Labyrinthula sp. TaxID=1678526 RepID=A0A7S6ZP82_9STRA|nr:apocytochrome b [Labyrinthula sp.]
MRRRWVKDDVLSVVNNHVVDYPTPLNISYMWGFGSVAGMCLVVQIVTGIFLSMHYMPDTNMAFTSVEHIMRDVRNGWLLRYLHANGASMFFVVVYIHMFRGLYYGSYMEPRGLLWVSGVAIYFVMVLTGFIGYVLPWGQMSYWGATVITNMVTAVPFVGQHIVEWLWGGYSIGNPTLQRFYSLHYVLPFAIAGLALVHLVLLHIEGSNNPLGVESKVDKVQFYPYYYVKDLFGTLVMITVLSWLAFYDPNKLGDPLNYIRADWIKTPEHIVPEWYFLPFYAILRSITDKTLGVVAMVVAILGLMTLPYTDKSEVRSAAFRPWYRQLYWLFVVDSIILGWVGGNVAEYPFVGVGQVAGVYYFMFIFVLVPLIGRLETRMMRVV